jgi:ABC-2 type transport system permease protein
MIKMIQIELFKLSQQKRTYYGIAVIIAIELFIILGAYVQGKEVLAILLENLSQSFILEGNLMNGHLVMYLVLNSLWFNFPLILMILVSGIMTNEYKDGTIQTTFLQAVSKREWILAKYATAIIFTLIVCAILIISSMCLAYGLFGQGDLITYLNGLNFIESPQAYSRILAGYASGTLLMICYGVCSISLAIWFKDQTITWILCAFLLIFNGLLLKIDFGWFNSWLLPKVTNSWQLFFYYDMNLSTIWHHHAVLMAYSLLIIALGIISFERKEI